MAPTSRKLPFQMTRKLACHVCQLTAAKIADKLDDVDDKRTIKIGHRLVTGQYGAGKKVKFSRSEVRIVKILEEVCGDLGHFSLTATINGTDMFGKSADVHEKTGVENVVKHGDETKAVKNSCQILVEDTEDQLTELMVGNDRPELFDELEPKLCTEFSSRCVDLDGTEPPKKKKRRGGGKSKKKKKKSKNNKDELR